MIKRRLPFIILLLVSVSIIILSALYYEYISNQMVQHNKDRIHQVLNMEEASIDTFFETRKMEVSYLSKNKMVQDFIEQYEKEPGNNRPDFRMENTKLCKYFANLVNESENIRDALVISPYGLNLATNRPDALWIDLSDRQYFKEAIKGKTTISNLIKNKVDGDSVLIVATPVFNETEQKIMGVMAIIINMRNVSDSMRKLIDPEIGNAYLVDESGEIVFHTNKLLIGSKPEITEVSTYLDNPSLPPDGEHVFTGKDYHVYLTYKSIKNTQWKLVIEQNMNVLMDSAYQALYVILILAALILTASGLIAVIYAHSITKPIIEISEVMNKATQGDLGIRVDYSSKNELGILSKNLNYMMDELIGAYEELETKNEELLATEEELRLNYEELDRKQKELKITQDKYVMALQGAKDAVWEWNHDDNRFFVSELWENITGKSTYCDTIHEIVFEEILQKDEKDRILKAFDEHWSHKTDLISITVPYLTPGGNSAWLIIRAHTVWDEQGNKIKTTGILADISEQIEAQEKIHNLAFVHQLTNLPNRTAFMLALEAQLGHEADNSKYMALLQLDIDNFKRINDSLGHGIGDQLLIEVADRLKELEEEAFRVYHISGDGFAFISSGCNDKKLLDAKAEQIIEVISKPFSIQMRTINISVSLGISTYPKDADTAEKLIQNADTAMYTAKESGKAQYVYFTEVMAEAVVKRVEIEEILRRAVSDQLVYMNFQPQYLAKDQRLMAFEALMRIRTDEGKFISPADFIPIAEETGLIIRLGEWALRHVCETIHNWTEQGNAFSHISINVSGIQLKQKDFAETIERITSECGISPGQLELELTESILLNIMDETTDMLFYLKQKGYKIALDDFGTGYSSFSYLRKMPLNTLKIDKSFIDDIESSRKDMELVRQIVDMAHDMGLYVIAEGVERKQQFDILKSIRCDYIQGYYFNRPLSLEKASELWLRSNREK